MGQVPKDSEARKFLEELKKLQHKAPRSGIHPTKILPDKTKYSRKIKHKKST